MYRVLEIIYKPAPGDTFTVSWREIGTAIDMQDAIAKYGGHPVLEFIKPLRRLH